MRKGERGMNMLKTVLIRLGLAVFAALPVERVLAMLLNACLDRIGGGNLDKALKTAGHLTELAALFNDILADKTVSEDEVGTLKEVVTRARERLLAAWATGVPAKTAQTELGRAGVDAAYVEPVLTDK